MQADGELVRVTEGKQLSCGSQVSFGVIIVINWMVMGP